MVKYDRADAIPLSTFEFAWRITDPKWTSLPDKVLSRITPLSPSKSKELLERSPCSRLSDRLFDSGRYHISQQMDLEDAGNSESDRARQWLRQLPIAADREVYLCWQVGEGVAAATDWGTFIQLWDSLWYPFDRLCVFDEAQQWAVVLGPEERALFIESNAAHG